jgi:hypothetical protein
MEITFSKIIRWIVGLLFLLTAFGSLLQSQIAGAIISILIAIVCIPAIADPIEKSINLKMSGAIRFVLVFVLILGIATVTPHTTQNTGVAADSSTGISGQSAVNSTPSETQNTTSSTPVTTPTPAKNTQKATSTSAATSTPSNGGTLNIVTNPEGATITVDGVSEGVSPIEGLSVKSGTRSVTAYLSGYEPQHEKVEVENNETKELTYTLNPSEEQSSTSMSNSETTSSDTESTSSNSADSSNTTENSKPQVVAEWSGSSIKNTETFHITSDEWTIAWATKPGEYGNMNFQIYIYNSDGTLKDVAANVIGASNDHTVERGAGDYYLEINTAQPYKIEVAQ